MNNYYKTILVFLCLMVLFCQVVKDEISKNEDNMESVWVYVDFAVPDEDTPTYYHFFGEMEKNIYERITKNKLKKGFITLRNIRYMTLDESIQIYEDDQDKGVVSTRVEYLQFIKLQKGDPIHIYPEEKLTQRSLKQRKIELQEISNSY